VSYRVGGELWVYALTIDAAAVEAAQIAAVGGEGNGPSKCVDKRVEGRAGAVVA